MSKSRIPLVLLASLVLAPLAVTAQPMPAGAPPGGAGAPGEGPRPLGVEFLLANTGPLELTDQQVTRLAAVARRAYRRRATLRARADPARAAAVRMPEAARQAPDWLAGAPAMRDLALADLTEAIAVLTPEQQALAWQLVSARGRGDGPEPAAGPPGPARPPGG